MLDRSHTRSDRLFRRYAQTRDPGALAGVFDATAPELLRVALHLTGSLDAAEDAVQSTFLTAMENADRFRPEGRVVPWLVGILGNTVRKARARDARRPDPERLHATAPSDPAAVAARHELQATVQDAMSELSDEHRQLLKLHLQHGLSSRQIADVLGRPPANVRARLARAMEGLRRALPLGLASAIAVASSTALSAAMPAAILGRARRQLLQRAAVAARSAPPAGRTLGARRLALACAGAAMVAVLGWLWASRKSVLAPAPAGESNHRAAVPGELGGAANTGTATDAGRRAAVDLPDAECGRVLVRVHGPDGTPIPGVGVALASAPRRQTFTDDHGETILDPLPPGEVTIAVDRTPLLLPALVEPGSTAVVDVPLDGGTLTVRVVDVGGAPVAGATMLAYSMFDYVERPLGITDDGGTVTVANFVAGFRVGAEAAGHLVSEAAQPTFCDGAGASVQLTLGGRGQPLGGRVLSRRGRPLAGALVAVATIDDTAAADRLPLLLHSGADGTFATDRAPEGPVWIYARDPRDPTAGVYARRHELATGGSQGLTLQLGAGGRVFGRVTDEDGRPLPGLRIDLRHQGYILSVVDQMMRHARTETDADGSFDLAGLAPGRYTGLVSFGAGREERAFAIVDGSSTEWRVGFARGAELAVRLTRPDGEPHPDWMVRVWDHPGRELSRARSDRDGRVRFAGLPQRPLLVTAQPEPSYLPICRGSAIPGRGEVRLQSADFPGFSASLSVHVVTEGGETVRRPVVHLRAAGWPQPWPLFAVSGEIDLRLPPARYRLSVRESALHPEVVLGPREVRAGASWEIGDLVLPTTAHVRVTATPAALAKTVRLEVEDASGELRAVPANEAYVEPGERTLWLHGPGVAPRALVVGVAAGEEREQAVTLRAVPSTDVVLVLPDAQPRLVAGTLTARDAGTGEVVLRQSLRAGLHGQQQQLTLRCGLPAGKVTIAAEVTELSSDRVLRGETTATTTPAQAISVILR